MAAGRGLQPSAIKQSQQKNYHLTSVSTNIYPTISRPLPHPHPEPQSSSSALLHPNIHPQQNKIKFKKLRNMMSSSSSPRLSSPSSDEKSEGQTPQPSASRLKKRKSFSSMFTKNRKTGSSDEYTPPVPPILTTWDLEKASIMRAPAEATIPLLKRTVSGKFDLSKRPPEPYNGPLELGPGMTHAKMTPEGRWIMLSDEVSTTDLFPACKTSEPSSQALDEFSDTELINNSSNSSIFEMEIPGSHQSLRFSFEPGQDHIDVVCYNSAKEEIPASFQALHSPKPKATRNSADTHQIWALLSQGIGSIASQRNTPSPRNGTKINGNLGMLSEIRPKTAMSSTTKVEGLMVCNGLRTGSDFGDSVEASMQSTGRDADHQIPSDITKKESLEMKAMRDWKQYFVLYSEGRFNLSNPPDPPTREYMYGGFNSKKYMAAPLAPNEQDRLCKLQPYLELEGPEYCDKISRILKNLQSLDRYTYLTVSLVGTIETILYSQDGQTNKRLKREESIAAHTILGDPAGIVIQDCATDWRFVNNPYIRKRNWRFIASVPLITIDNIYIGALTILDNYRRPFKHLAQMMTAATDIAGILHERVLSMKIEKNMLRDVGRVDRELVRARYHGINTRYYSFPELEPDFLPPTPARVERPAIGIMSKMFWQPASSEASHKRSLYGDPVDAGYFGRTNMLGIANSCSFDSISDQSDEYRGHSLSQMTTQEGRNRFSQLGMLKAQCETQFGLGEPLANGWRKPEVTASRRMSSLGNICTFPSAVFASSETERRIKYERDAYGQQQSTHRRPVPVSRIPAQPLLRRSEVTFGQPYLNDEAVAPGQDFNSESTFHAINQHYYPSYSDWAMIDYWGERPKGPIHLPKEPVRYGLGDNVDEGSKADSDADRHALRIDNLEASRASNRYTLRKENNQVLRTQDPNILYLEDGSDSGSELDEDTSSEASF